MAILTVLVVLLATLAACAGGGVDAGTAGVMPTLDGATLLEARCNGVCHNLDRVDAKDLDFANWLPVLDKMLGNGATLTPEEKTVLAGYLANK